MNFVEGQTVGIDLGTSYSAISQLDEDGNPVVYENLHGDQLTASVVTLEDGGSVIIGDPEDPEHVDPDSMVIGVKRQMGNADYTRVYQNHRLTADFISAMILRKLKQDTETIIGPIGNAVITVPYYFNDPCRTATVNAGQIAGINVIDIINEPTAATLAYVWMQGNFGIADPSQPEKTILVYDLGGGTFDVTVVKYTSTHFQVVATDGDTFLGGIDWTRRIVNFVSERFQQKFGMDPRDDATSRLMITNACDLAKRDLFQNTRTVIEAASRGRTLSLPFSRNDLERLTADLMQRTRDTTELVLELSGINPQELDDIILIGGSTHLPGVSQMLQDICGKEPSRVLDPQLAVAQGAAIHAAILEARHSGGTGKLGSAVLNRLKNVTTVDVNSHSLGVELTDPRATNGKRNHIMIKRNSRLPVEVQQRFVTDKPNPNGIRVRLLEGEASDVNACTFIGDFRITNLPQNLPAGSPVEIVYSYDSSRKIHVRARELTGNNEAAVEIVWEGAISQDALAGFQQLASQYQIE